MTIKTVFQALLFVFGALYAFKLVGIVATRFHASYFQVTAEHERMRIRLQSCEDNHETYDAFQAECDTARRDLAGSVWIVAAGRVFEELPSCVHFECLDVVEVVVQSWIALAFAACFAFVTFYVVAGAGLRWKGHLFRRKPGRKQAAIPGWETYAAPPATDDCATQRMLTASTDNMLFRLHDDSFGAERSSVADEFVRKRPAHAFARDY